MASPSPGDLPSEQEEVRKSWEVLLYPDLLKVAAAGT